jgi:hypothetical protein
MSRLRAVAIVGGIVLIVLVACSRIETGAAPPAEGKNDVPAVRTAECRRAASPIQVDGKLDELVFHLVIHKLAAPAASCCPGRATTARVDLVMYWWLALQQR